MCAGLHVEGCEGEILRGREAGWVTLERGGHRKRGKEEPSDPGMWGSQKAGQ